MKTYEPKACETEIEALRTMLTGVATRDVDLYTEGALEFWSMQTISEAIGHSEVCFQINSFDEVFDEWKMATENGMDSHNPSSTVYYRRLLAHLATYAPPEMKVVFAKPPRDIFLHDLLSFDSLEN